MRLTRVDINKFKRLVKTSFNMDSKLIAIVGPNEIGKSSVLQALNWFSSGEALPPLSRSRGVSVEEDEICVETTYILDDEDKKTISHLNIETIPTKFGLIRTVGGEAKFRLDVKRNPEPFNLASKSLSDVVESLQEDEHAKNGHIVAFIEALTEVRARVQDYDRLWTKDELDQARRVARVLTTPDAVNEFSEDEVELAHEPFDPEAGANLQTVIQAVSLDHPKLAAMRILKDRSPEFLLFSEDNRNLASEYDLSDEAVRASPPKALSNLLNVAGVPLDLFWDAIEDRDVTSVRTALRYGNERLEHELHSAWSQSRLTVRLDLDGTRLLILVRELDESGWDTAIEERSDGLKIFTAMMAFLANRDSDRPVILLIDEAETHLHLNAQADLVNVLLKQQEAAQIIYTTHSPACLPPDLGTGIRFVTADPAEPSQSIVRHDFWRESARGFSSLLFAMGAGFAVFSACRRAVVSEGPTEMILLPSMIRAATGLAELPYQVTLGLANLTKSSFELDLDAARIAWVVDGDAGGKSLIKLLKRHQVSESAIVSLPSGKTLEDLLDRGFYISCINELLLDAEFAPSERVSIEDLPMDMSIAKALRQWSEHRSISIPGKVAVASRLAQDPKKIQLSSKGKQCLIKLHGRFCNVLGVTEASAS